MGEAIVYVDGFNLYHGLRSRYGHRYHWLDLYALAQQMRRHDTIVKVRYFTAIVKGEPEAARRQEIYLGALAAHRPQVEVVRGHFKQKKFRCHQCGARWRCECDPPGEFRTWEEKLTDVALGVSLVKDAAQGYGDLSVLVTTDTDLNPALHACADVAPHRPILQACPPGRQPSKSAPSTLTSFLIRQNHLENSLLPKEVVSREEGKTYRQPTKWA